jgi:hypothetical protein
VLHESEDEYSNVSDNESVKKTGQESMLLWNSWWKQSH